MLGDAPDASHTSERKRTFAVGVADVPQLTPPWLYAASSWTDVM